LVERALRAVKAQIWEAQTDLNDRESRLRRASTSGVQHAEVRLNALRGRLQALSPMAVLGRGYAVLRDSTTHAVIKSAGQTAAGQHLDVLLGDGSLKVTVLETEQT
ncbi:MAG TPA: exodeoxyribonuclease VII large subunit, partial [Chloroflexota bacterium]|nr:exodeoxyribonuclease VII large subunit [Chloroflexota bacterium]